ncbi:energy-coupling factor ABC transporter ATP-binding protein [Massilia violaceinigra]|uniref:Energy-coupling factor ABC transporter ATP-binding protein n=1 Tax=Massilia violaceinigra TaxID=2045208 RepID=A0ABY4A8L7_9BURK|nr:energy-coupling factor ABC transporter ATP-binding protein [Massilia violaceinigra]UOD31161.1 energy-coupling factor ABC transporter ATP-binding protein [Massilia violaceinigra]
MTLLRIDRLRKAHGARVLFDLSAFALDAGRAYVLTGINGAGKSTLLRVLAGLEAGDASGVTWQGKPLALSPYPPALRAAIVYVHQHPVLFSTSVADNIGYGLRARGVPRAQAAQAVAQAMAWAGVGHLQGSDPARLSGGEVQRVALARAWVLRPSLLLLDEPSANLDGAAREQVISLIPALSAAGGTVVMACHDRDLIGLPGVQRLKLRDGRIETK